MKTFLRKKLVASLLGTTIFVSTSAVVADTAYVSDTLRVGVRPTPDSQVAPTGVIKTGMLLEILESTGDYVRVRTEDDLEGWVRDIYVVNTPPAMIKLQTLQQQHHKLEGKLTILEKNNQDLLEANQIMSRRLDQLSAERAKWQLSQARAALTNNEFSWLWWLLGILMLIGAGFYSGISWYRQSVTKRLGGLRI